MDALWGLDPKEMNNPKWGNPKPEIMWVPKFHFIHPIDVEKFAEFNGEIIFQIRPSSQNQKALSLDPAGGSAP